MGLWGWLLLFGALLGAVRAGPVGFPMGHPGAPGLGAQLPQGGVPACCLAQGPRRVEAPGVDLPVRILLGRVPMGEEVEVRFPGGTLRAWRVREGVAVEGQAYSAYGLPGPFTLRGTTYRGELWLWPEGEGLLLINRLPLEDYLLGVLPGEMPGSFPLEALKAQAVLARTYAVRRLSPQGPYDLCADKTCQVYLGLSGETPRHAEAVRATRGLVVSYRGQAISALYHADSGGMTAGSEEVFGQALPYLRPQADPYTRATPWSFPLSESKAKAALLALGLSPRTLEAPSVLRRTPSGRVGRLRLLGVEVEGPLAQRLVRALGLPSALVAFEGWQASGRGAGHGVGLSQWGAKGLAEAGYDFRAILGHYFPGTALSPLVVLRAQGRP